MRRSRWAEPEEEEKEKHDEPVTLTESQYRALKRGALFGTFGLALGFAATGLAVWSLARTPGEAERPVVAQATAQPSVPPPTTDTTITPAATQQAAPSAA
ncbi:MAG TPA: hypothetical protein VFP58_13305, partial [Candidatus Eisenbacteria bacterium]|nr:hypothetical protein [Candidatus Eisenbacteria bacterium]